MTLASKCSQTVKMVSNVSFSQQPRYAYLHNVNNGNECHGYLDSTVHIKNWFYYNKGQKRCVHHSGSHLHL